MGILGRQNGPIEISLYSGQESATSVDPPLGPMSLEGRDPYSFTLLLFNPFIELGLKRRHTPYLRVRLPNSQEYNDLVADWFLTEVEFDKDGKPVGVKNAETTGESFARTVMSYAKKHPEYVF